MAAANLAVSITARIYDLETKLNRAGQLIKSFRNQSERQSGFEIAAKGTKSLGESAIRTGGNVIVANSALRLLQRTASATGNEALLAASKYARWALAARSLASAVGGAVPIVGAAATGILLFQRYVESAIIRTLEWSGAIQNLTKDLKDTAAVQESLDKRRAGQIAAIADLERQLAIAKGAKPSSFLGGRARELAIELEQLAETQKRLAAEEAITNATEQRMGTLLQEMAVLRGTATIYDLIANKTERQWTMERDQLRTLKAQNDAYAERRKSLGPSTLGEASKQVLLAIDELKAIGIGENLLEAALRSFGPNLGVKIDELRSRLGLPGRGGDIPAERAAGTVERFATGRFQFGPNAMGAKTQDVEDKTTHKLLGEVVRNTRNSGATWQ